MTYSYNPQTGQITDDEDGQLIATMSESATPEQAKLLASAPTLEAATEELHRVSAINAELEQALNDAATSLETIHLRSYGENSNLSTMPEVRGYAASRANVARQALEKAKQ